MLAHLKINLAYLRLMGSIVHGHVLHVLISVPWVRLDDVKDVVHDGLCAVVLVALGSVVVQVSSTCLTNKQACWFYINKKKSPGASTRA